MNKTNNTIIAQFNSKPAWVTLWALSLVGLLLSLRSLSLIKPVSCIVLCAVSFVLCVAGTLIGVSTGRTKLCVDEKYVYCKTLFGSEKYIPAEKITGFKTTAFNTVCVCSPSFTIRCHFVKNKQEIVEAIKQLSAE